MCSDSGPWLPQIPGTAHLHENIRPKSHNRFSRSRIMPDKERS